MAFDLDRLHGTAPFGLPQAAKADLQAEALSDLTLHHYTHCAPYRRLLDAFGIDPALRRAAADTPFIPVRLFKEFELLSVDRGQITRTMTSSGTTGQQPSRIFLDRETAVSQARALARTVADFAGPARLPLLVLDTPAVLKDRTLFSARGAGVLGFSLLGRDVTYAFCPDMALDVAAVESFCAKHAGSPVLIFGFTYMVWEHFCLPLLESGRQVDLRGGVLFHGGGWKKLAERAVDNETFKKRLAEVGGITRVHNYYGMVEQTGSIAVECEAGRLHASVYADLFARRPDFTLCEPGETGLLHLVSLLPRSYPGHSVLTEDLGRSLGVDDCPCGRLGRSFAVQGRVEQAEARGCSDTYAAG